MISFDVKSWTGDYSLPTRKDVRWAAFGLLFFYLVMGTFFLGFDRKPLQIIALIAFGAIFDLVLNGVFKQRKVFPLSAMISCCSLALLLNWSYAFQNLWIPVFICIISKYLLTLNGRHFFNPSLFAIVICLIFTDDLITLAPSYQWYGSAATASMMIWFVVTGALFLFVFKINRNWLIGSFLVVFVLQTLYRAHVMEHIIPWETLWMSSLSSPAFYLFTFYMITDPGTSPSGKWEQILIGSSIGLLDLIFHLKLSYYTFFFAGFAVAGVRYLYFIAKTWYKEQGQFLSKNIQLLAPRYAIAAVLFLPILLSFQKPTPLGVGKQLNHFFLERIDPSESGLGFAHSTVLEDVDPRVAHVAKWVISVGDAAASADIDLDGDQDLFLTQILKDRAWRGKLHINQGNFKFEKRSIPALEPYLNNPKDHGLPGFGLFMDYDNDGDSDLFVGFGFGKSHLFENRMIPDDSLSFVEVDVPYLQENHTICLAANALDFNNDGLLDLIQTNTLQAYLPGYETPTPLNIFNLPAPAHDGDRRMFHFLHESWHNANNGGFNYLLQGTGNGDAFTAIPAEQSMLKETRWSLAVGTADLNDDGWTDVYIANDFGRDDCYLNQGGTHFERVVGTFYGDIGLDTYKGMNVSVGDLDRNQKDDIYISNVHHAMQAEGSLLWMNYTEEKEKLLLEESATTMNALNTKRFGWGAGFADLNLDGWEDIIQANGMVDDSWDKLYDERVDFWYYQAQIARTGPEIHSYADKWADIRGASIYENEPDRIMLNHDGTYFNDYASSIGFDHEENTRGICLSDFDNDGDADILITDQFGAPILYENKVSQKHWVGIKLEGNGTSTNRDAVGSKVYLEYKVNGEPQIQYKEARLANGFMSMNDQRLLFGMGSDTGEISDMSIKVKWHNGETVTYPVSDWNQYHTITQEKLAQ